MKHIELAACYRKIVIILINKGFVEEVVPPKRNPQIRMCSKISQSGLDWSLAVPSDGLLFTVVNGKMYYEHTNKRTGYVYKREFAPMIENLNPSINRPAYQELQELLAKMKWLVGSLCLEHKGSENIKVTREQRRQNIKQALEKQRQSTKELA